MAKPKRQRQARVSLLLSEHWSPLEARELSRLPRNTPALKAMRKDRIARWERFVKIVNRKIETGKWEQADVQGKWVANLARMYRKNNLRVQYGPTGKQQRMVKGAPNVWALYRRYVKITPDKRYRSPWELRPEKKGGPPLLNRVVLYTQRARRVEQKGGTVSSGQIQSWIAQLNTGIRRSRGARRRQLIQQRDNLLKKL